MARGGLFFLSLRLAEAQGLVPAGTCAALAKLPDRALAQAAVEVGQALSARTGGVLPLAMDELALYLSLLHPLDAGVESYQPPFTPCLAPPDLGDFPEGKKTLEAPAPELEALCTAFERGHVGELPKGARRQTGVYYTPKETAAHVVELGLTQGSVRAE
ncbi:MAG: hypothetical protein JST92_15580, partial [Deltaproteobacteria bacterium]|nr:hypothetical protein [Deltaproteobacteria bacterium]